MRLTRIRAVMAAGLLAVATAAGVIGPVAGPAMAGTGTPERAGPAPGGQGRPVRSGQWTVSAYAASAA